MIRNNRIIDGTGEPAFDGEVGIVGKRIVAMHSSLSEDAHSVIDAARLVVAPGFVDAHTHDDLAALRRGTVLPKVHQGITSVVIGNCGFRPGAVIVGWVFPLMIVLMFGLLFGLETTMIAITTDASKGVTDRFRSLPMSASAVVLGRCIADMLNSIVGLALLIGARLLLGWRWHAGLDAALVAVGLLLLLRFALLWVGIFFGLLAKGPESVSSVQILVWPISFLSNVFVSPSTMPSWLGAIAQWNTLSATTSAIRQLFMNPGWQAGFRVSEHAVLMALVWPMLLVAIFLPLSVRIYRRLNR